MNGSDEFGVKSAACTIMSILVFQNLGPMGTGKGVVGEQGAISSCNALT